MRTRLLVVMFLLAALCGAVYAAPPDPTLFPGSPTDLPPPISPGPFRGSGPAIEYDLPAGWSMISFPLANVEGAEGFPRALLLWKRGEWIAIDPINQPEKVDPCVAYATWVDQPTRVRVRGRLSPLPVWHKLRPGWNMLGCPSPHPIPLNQITLTREGGVTRTLGQAASMATTPSEAWIYGRVTISPNGKTGWVNVTDANAQLVPGEDTWIFAWASCLMNFNGTPTGKRPVIKSVSPPTVAPGSVIDIRGSGFGARGDGIITLSGVEFEASDVVAWSNTSIRVKVPPSAKSGALLVLVNRFPSTAVPVKITPAKLGVPTVAAQAGGALTGRVECPKGRAIANAQVMLDNGQTAMTGADGTFLIDNVPPGTYGAYIRAEGYRDGSGRVRVEAGASRRLLVSLSSPNASMAPGHDAEPEDPKGTMWIEAYRYTSGDTVWFVKRIEAWEYGDHRKSWSAGSWSTNAQSRDLQCSGAPSQRTYVVKIIWRTEAGAETSSTSYRKLSGTSQTFRFYGP